MIFFLSFPRTIYEKFLLYKCSQGQLVKELHYPLFYCLLRVCNKWYKKSVKNLKCNMITYHKTTALIVSSNHQTWKLFCISSENVYIFPKWQNWISSRILMIWFSENLNCFWFEKKSKVIKVFKLLLNITYRTGSENIL